MKMPTITDMFIIISRANFLLNWVEQETCFITLGPDYAKSQSDQCFSWLVVCVEVLWPSQPNGVMLSVVSLLNHTFTGQA